MTTEQQIRRKRKLPEPVSPQTAHSLVDPSADSVIPIETDLEAEVVAERERELIPQLPESAEALLTATFGEAGLSGLTELQTRFVRADAALLASTAVEQRLRRYLYEGETTVPSRYARALVQAGQAIEQLFPVDRRTLAELQFYLVSELNPLLRQWQMALQPYLGETDPLHTTEGLLEALSYGNVEYEPGREQRTVSAIGLLRRLGQTQTDFVPFQVEAPTYPERLVIERPFSDDTKEYWRDRVQCAELYHATEPNQLIGWRTRHLQDVLEEAATALTGADSDPEHRRLVAAYETMADWLDIHAEAMEQPLQIDRSETDQATFDYYISRMDFTHGDTNDIIGVLNAAEVIKQHNPELFMRMAGIAPNVSSADQEAQRSDLFGSAFHMAFYRTLQLNHPRFQMLRQQVQELTQLEAKAKPLARLNERQVRQIADKFQEAALAEKPDTMLLTMIATTLASLIAGHPREVALALMVNSVEQDSRTETLERLQAAGARDFYMLIQSVPDALLDDPACIDIVRKRLELSSGEAARQHIKFIREWNQRSAGISGRLRGRYGYKDFNWDLKTTLWKTASDEAVLTEDFWEYIETAQYYFNDHHNLFLDYERWQIRTQQAGPLNLKEWRNEERQDERRNKGNSRRRIRKAGPVRFNRWRNEEIQDLKEWGSTGIDTEIKMAVYTAVAAHPHISKTQWLKWYNSTGGLPKERKNQAMQKLVSKIYGRVLIEDMVFDDTSFAVLFGPEASRSLNSLGQYAPTKDTSHIDSLLGPTVAGELGDRTSMEHAIKKPYRSMSNPAREKPQPQLVKELRTAYRLLSTDCFVRHYREQLIHLGATYIMELRHEASEADFAEFIDALYVLSDPQVALTSLKRGELKDPHVDYPEIIMAENPWQLEVYDALERWIAENPSSRPTCQLMLDRITQEFFTRTDFRLVHWYNYSSHVEQRLMTHTAVNHLSQEKDNSGKSVWKITQTDGTNDPRLFWYDSKIREIVETPPTSPADV